MAEVAFSNIWQANKVKMGIVSALFLVLLVSIAGAWLFFVSRGIDLEFSNTGLQYLFVFGLIFFILVALSMASGAFRARQIVFFSTGGTSLVSSVLAIFLAVIFGFFFGYLPFAASPINPFSFTLPQGGDLLNAAKFFINFSFIASIASELYYNAIFLLSFVLLTVMFNRGFEFKRGVAVFLLSMLVVGSLFALDHNYSYTIQQNKEIASYQANPAQWTALNPGKPIPADPSTGAGFMQIAAAIVLAFFFRFFNTIVILITGDIYQGIKNSAFASGFLMMLNPAFPTNGLWLLMGLLILLCFVVDLIENQFAKLNSVSS